MTKIDSLNVACQIQVVLMHYLFDSEIWEFGSLEYFQFMGKSIKNITLL
jgi:hypothetical protein